HILWIGRIDQRAQPHEDIARAHLGLSEGVIPGPRVDLVYIVVLIDHHHRHEALARSWQGYLDGPGIEIKDRLRIKRIAVGTHDNAFKRQIAEVDELAERAA